MVTCDLPLPTVQPCSPVSRASMKSTLVSFFASTLISIVSSRPTNSGSGALIVTSGRATSLPAEHVLVENGNHLRGLAVERHRHHEIEALPRARLVVDDERRRLLELRDLLLERAQPLHLLPELGRVRHDVFDADELLQALKPLRQLRSRLRGGRLALRSVAVGDREQRE